MNVAFTRPPHKVPTHQRAEGQLDLSLRQADGGMRMERFYQQGCLKARCLRVGRDAEIVSINISGGIAGGDRLDTSLQLAPGGRAAFTTQAAERVYRSHGASARVKTSLKVGAGACLAYLPQETILFDGFALDRTLEVDLAEEAEFVGVESLIFGRLAMGERLESGHLRDRINVRRGGRLVWRDVAKIEGNFSAQMSRAGVGGAACAMANIFAAGRNLGTSLPRLVDIFGDSLAGVSLQGDIILLRLLAAEMSSLRQSVTAALAVLRGGALPRVWQS